MSSTSKEEEKSSVVEDTQGDGNSNPEFSSQTIDSNSDQEEDSGSAEEEIDSKTQYKINFLDAENLKVHKFIRLTKSGSESEFVNVEDVSSESEVEVTDTPDKNAYIKIDPDDYQVVHNAIKSDPENNNLEKRIEEVTPPQKKKARESSDGQNNNPMPLSCRPCNLGFFTPNELSLHMSTKHTSKSESSRAYSAAEIQELEREMRDQADDCPSCGQAIWYLPTLRAHAMIHPTGKSDCDACQHGTSIVKKLMNHLEDHVGTDEEDSD